MLADRAADSTDIVFEIMVTKFSVHISVESTGFHFYCIRSNDFFILPLRKLAPFAVGKLLLVIGVALRCDLGHKEPTGVIAAFILEAVAVIAGVIAVMGSRVGGAVEGMEGIVAVMLVAGGVGVTVIAPVIVQITGDLGAVDYGFGQTAFVFPSGNGSIVISCVQLTSGVEPGGPGYNIVHLSGACSLPAFADIIVTVQSAFR